MSAPFFQLEKPGGRRERGAAKSLVVRTATACKITTSTVHNLHRRVSGTKQDKTRGCPKVVADALTRSVTRGKVHGFNSRRDHPTVDKNVLPCARKKTATFQKCHGQHSGECRSPLAFTMEQTPGDKQPHEVPSGKGKRPIIQHAGWKGGFLPGCELVFVGNTKSHDYHDEMNAKHFAEWWRQKLLSSIKQHIPAGEPVWCLTCARFF